MTALETLKRATPNLFHFFFCLISGATSLRLIQVVIPPYKLRGENALLECQYELNNNNKHKYGLDGGYHNNYDSSEQNDEGEALYSVKWYKDNEEFYRFVPRANPPQHSYKIEGIKVDVSFSFFFLFVLFSIFFNIEKM